MTMSSSYPDFHGHLGQNDVFQVNNSDFYLGFPTAQMSLTAPLAGSDAADQPSFIDMDEWKSFYLPSESELNQIDNNNNNNNNNNSFPIMAEVSSDFSLDDSNHPPPSEPPKPAKRLGRPPGRRSQRAGGKEKPPGRLWKFILEILEDPRRNPTIITWVDKNRGVFRFVQSDKVAQLWGEVKRNPNMTYEKMSRALRYYKSGAFAPVSQRLVYAFGKKVSWNSDGRRVTCG